MAKVTANEEIKRYNRSSIYAALREHGPLSRQDLVRELQLSLPTVTQNLANLQDEGLIDQWIEEYSSIAAEQNAG